MAVNPVIVNTAKILLGRQIIKTIMLITTITRALCGPGKRCQRDFAKFQSAHRRSLLRKYHNQWEVWLVMIFVGTVKLRKVSLTALVPAPLPARLVTFYNIITAEIFSEEGTEGGRQRGNKCRIRGNFTLIKSGRSDIFNCAN